MSADNLFLINLNKLFLPEIVSSQILTILSTHYDQALQNLQHELMNSANFTSPKPYTEPFQRLECSVI